MQEDLLFFFEQHPEALPIYEALEDKVRKEIGNVQIKVQKSQISFYCKHMFACVSFVRVRKKADCPPAYIIVSFGLNYKVESPRIEAAAEPYPNRWTHHVLVSRPEDIDEELMDWLRNAAAFAEYK